MGEKLVEKEEDWGTFDGRDRAELLGIQQLLQIFTSAWVENNKSVSGTQKEREEINPFVLELVNDPCFDGKGPCPLPLVGGPNPTYGLN